MENMENKVNKELEEKVALQAAQIDKLLAQNAELIKCIQTGKSANTVDNSYVKVIGLIDRTPSLSTHIKLTNLVLDFTTFGESRLLTQQQFEELLGTHRALFEDGTLALADDYKEIAVRQHVKTESDYKLNRKIIDHLDSLSPNELSDVVKGSPAAHKQMIFELWFDRAQQKIPSYCDLTKLQILNGLSDGGFENFIKSYTKTK